MEKVCVPPLWDQASTNHLMMPSFQQRRATRERLRPTTTRATSRWEDIKCSCLINLETSATQGQVVWTDSLARSTSSQTNQGWEIHSKAHMLRTSVKSMETSSKRAYSVRSNLSQHGGHLTMVATQGANWASRDWPTTKGAMLNASGTLCSNN